MREEWELYGAEDDDTGERLPYPGDWQAAQEAILNGFSDGSWTPFEITAHDVDFGPVVEAAGDIPALLSDLASFAARRADTLQEMADEAEEDGDEKEAAEYQSDAHAAYVAVTRARGLVEKVAEGRANA